VVAVGLAGAGAAVHALVASHSTAPIHITQAGLSDTERNALYERNTAAFQARLQAWYAHLDQQHLDLRTLKRVGMMASVEPAAASTLAAALAQSDAAVTVVVQAVHTSQANATALPESDVTVTVVNQAKGSVPRSIVLHQLGGVVPTLDWSGALIEDADGQPLLLPGDRAVLLLIRNPGGASYRLESYTGEYLIDSRGYVTAMAGNPFHDSVTGATERAFEAAIAAALHR
jgi:hypothetical protein